ncbi:MAG: cell division protein ZapD [Gammaproteobacteria bacterium]
MTDYVIYEQPLNERMRTFLRLEHLFCQTDYTLRGYSVWDSRATLTSLVDTLEILSRSDLKTELLKELERHIGKLASLQQSPGVDQEQLGAILQKLDHAQQSLLKISGQIGQALREQELINSIRQRMTIPGGSCPIDLPIFHLWLQQPAEARIEQQEQWNRQLYVVRDLPYFAEISAGKHRLTIRFLEPQAGRRPLQAQESVEFELTCCTL